MSQKETLMKQTVLIVDDSPILRMAAKRAVTQVGIPEDQIREAGNGKEAIQLLFGELVDLILLDIHMPIMDGEVFVAKIMENPSWSKIPIIIVSTESNKGRIQRLEDLGVRGFLHKPFEPEDLRSLVGELLGDTA